VDISVWPKRGKQKFNFERGKKSNSWQNTRHAEPVRVRGSLLVPVQVPFLRRNYSAYRLRRIAILKTNFIEIQR